MRTIGLVFFLFGSTLLYGQTLEDFIGDSKVVGIGYYSGLDKNSGLFHQEVLSSMDQQDSKKYLFDLDISHTLLLYLGDTTVNFDMLSYALFDFELDSSYIDFLVQLLNLARNEKIEVIGEISFLSVEHYEYLAKKLNNEALVNFLESYRKHENTPDSIINIIQLYSKNPSSIGMSEFEFLVFKSVLYKSSFNITSSELNDFSMNNFDRIYVMADNLTLKKSTEIDDFPIEKKIYLISDIIKFSSKKNKKFKCNIQDQKLTPFFEKECLKLALNYRVGCKKYSFEPQELIYYLEMK